MSPKYKKTGNFWLNEAYEDEIKEKRVLKEIEETIKEIWESIQEEFEYNFIA